MRLKQYIKESQNKQVEIKQTIRGRDFSDFDPNL